MCPLVGQLLDGDNRHNGGILDQGDKLPGQGRQHLAEGLRQDNMAQTLTPGKPKGMGGLPLPAVHGLDACAQDLGDIGPLKHGQGQHRRHKGGDRGGRGNKDAQPMGCPWRQIL